MTNGEEYPESLKKLLKSNDDMHEAVADILADDSYTLHNRLEAAHLFRMMFAHLEMAKPILGWEAGTPPPEEE